LGISGPRLVNATGAQGALAFLGSGGVPLAALRFDLAALNLNLPVGVNLPASPWPGRDQAVVEACLQAGVERLEISGFFRPTDAVLSFRFRGIAERGTPRAIFAKLSRFGVAQRMLEPLSPRGLARLAEKGLIGFDDAIAAAGHCAADGLFLEGDSGGHTDSRAVWPLLSAIRAAYGEDAPILARLARKAYEPLLGLVLRFRPVVVLIAVLIFVGGGWLASRMGAEFVPRLDEGAIALQAVRPPSVSLEESVAATTRIERVLLDAYPDEIDTIVSRTGRAEIATDPMGIEISDIYLILHPIEEWTRADSKVELVERIDATLAESIAGQNFSFSQPIELRTNELISGVRSDVAVNLYGPDFAELEEAGERVMRVLRSVDGAVDVNASQVAGLPAVRIVVDREAAGRYGINASEILDAVSAIGGRPVGTVFEGQRRFSLQVRLTEAARANPEVLRELLVSAPGGERVPLGQVAQVLLEEGPAVVSRESAQRRMTIQLNVRGRDLAGFVAEAQERVRAEANLPPGYFVTWGGQFENLQAATSRLALAVPLALLLIFLLLYTTFGSARPALIIYLNIPMAAVGGVLALWLRGMPFSISAAVGFIALSGIAVLNGVVMVSYIRDLQREGLSLMDATEKGARLRLRAVLMTALTDGIGFLPMAISTSAGAEVQRPLATVVIGGLFTATLLTLFVLPAVYSWLGGMAVEEDDENEIPADMEGVEA